MFPSLSIIAKNPSVSTPTLPTATLPAIAPTPVPITNQSTTTAPLSTAAVYSVIINSLQFNKASLPVLPSAPSPATGAPESVTLPSETTPAVASAGSPSVPAGAIYVIVTVIKPAPASDGSITSPSDNNGGASAAPTNPLLCSVTSKEVHIQPHASIADTLLCVWIQDVSIASQLSCFPSRNFSPRGYSVIKL